jgi:uncharacterized membrane protein
MKANPEHDAFNAAMDTSLKADPATVKAETEQDKQERAERKVILKSGRESSKLRTVNGIIEKRCNICDRWKPLSEFSGGGKKHEGSEAGKHCECRDCNNEKHRRNYRAKKER